MYEEIKRFTPIVASFSLIQCPLHNTGNTVGDKFSNKVILIKLKKVKNSGKTFSICIDFPN